MEAYMHSQHGSFYAIRLDKGDDLLNSIENFIEQNHIRDAVILSGIGTLDQCCMHFVTHTDDASKMDFKEWNDTPLEIASISGIIADGTPHLHMVVSTNENSWGGHVEPGCRTLYLCELMLMTLPGFYLTRTPKTTDISASDFYIKNLTVK